MSTYLHGTSSNEHFDLWYESLQRTTDNVHSLLGQGTSSLGHVSRWVVVISEYLPVTLQWGHWCWRYGHFMRCWSRSRRKIFTSLSFSMHSLVQRRRAYSHVMRWLSRDRNSPSQPHPLLLLLHITLSDLISCSPIRNSVVRCATCSLAHQKFTHLWCQESPVLFSDSLDKWQSASCVDSGRHCSRLSHSMSIGVGWQIQEGRSDTSACLVVCPQICSHIHQPWEHWKPSVSYTCRGRMAHFTSTHNTDNISMDIMSHLYTCMWAQWQTLFCNSTAVYTINLHDGWGHKCCS